MSTRPRAAHHAKNCPTARPYAGRRASDGSTPGLRSCPPRSPAAGRRSRLDERLELLVIVRERLGEREEPPDGVLRPAEAHLDPPGGVKRWDVNGNEIP